MGKGSSGDPVAEILARENELMEAKNRAGFLVNPRSILSFYDSKAIRLFDLHSMQLVGDAVGDMFAAVSPEFIGEARINNVEVVAGEDVAFSSLIEVYSGYLRETREDVTLTFRMTHGWRKVDGQWVIVHEHWSYPVDAATGVARTNDPLP